MLVATINVYPELGAIPATSSTICFSSFRSSSIRVTGSQELLVEERAGFLRYNLGVGAEDVEALTG